MFGRSILQQNADELLEASNHAEELNHNYNAFDYSTAFEDIMAQEDDRFVEPISSDAYELVGNMEQYICASQEVGKNTDIIG